MTISKRDLKLILCLAGIVVFLALYLGVYNHFNAKAEETRTATAALTPELDELRGYSANQQTYTDGIAAAQATVSELSYRYPNDVRAEDKIMFISALERQLGLSVSAASFSEPAPLLDFSTIRENETGYETVPVSAFSSGMSLSCILTYPELKSALSYIYDQSYVHSLESVSVSFDSTTGELYGTMNIQKYFITGEDGAYHPTEVPSYPLGTNNIFGSITSTPAQP